MRHSRTHTDTHTDTRAPTHDQIGTHDRARSATSSSAHAHTRAALALALTTLLAACGDQSSGGDDNQKTADPVPAQQIHSVNIITPESNANEGAAASESSAGTSLGSLDAAAEAVVADLAKQLQGHLMMSMQVGGPTQAVSVCHTLAPNLTLAASEKHGMQIRRVALRYRNPEIGAPNDWQRAVLQDFEARAGRGESVAALRYTDVVDGEYRFMKAIPTGEPCLACHGESIAPEVAEQIRLLYPGDQATGYALGDVRGAFVVTKPL